MSVCAVIVAGGKGQRMQSAIPKQYLDLQGRPVLAWSIAAFEACPVISKVVLVVPRGDNAALDIISREGFCKVVSVVTGGATRSESVLAGLNALPPEATHVAIHDGVRPLITRLQIERVIDQALKTGAAILAAPSRDTLKQASPDQSVHATLDREIIWRAQTPQVFRIDLLRAAYEHAGERALLAPDDAAIVEQLGEKVYIVTGSESNLKVTTPVDLLLADAILASRVEAQGPTPAVEGNR